MDNNVRCHETRSLIERIPRDPFIGGKFITGLQETRDVLNPYDSTSIARISIADNAQCQEAIDAAGEAQEAWAEKSPRERSEILMAAFELMSRDRENIARLITLENGKSLTDSNAEVRYAAEFFRWFAEESVRSPGEMKRSPTGQNWILVSHEPVGVALLITPWNFPAAMATRKIAPALAAGCTVVLKPATETPLTALYIARIMSEAGVPDGVLNVVLAAPARRAVNAMMADERVRAVSFTGSTEVGKTLLEQASKCVAKPSMELGGNAPFIVLNDADIDAALDGVMLAKFRNGGAACTAANRIFVQNGIADEFVSRLIDKVMALEMGNGLNPGVDIGPMVSEAERDRVAKLVTSAVSQGAHVLCGSTVPDDAGFFYTPTVLENVDPTSDIAQEEIFGPVAIIIKFDDAGEAIQQANNTESGLVSYVYTENLKTGLNVSRQLQSGMVGLNRGLVSDPAAPFGGTKESGLGREGSSEGMLEFMETKYIATPYA